CRIPSPRREIIIPTPLQLRNQIAVIDCIRFDPKSFRRRAKSYVGLAAARSRRTGATRGVPAPDDSAQNALIGGPKRAHRTEQNRAEQNLSLTVELILDAAAEARHYRAETSKSDLTTICRRCDSKLTEANPSSGFPRGFLIQVTNCFLPIQT